MTVSASPGTHGPDNSVNRETRLRGLARRVKLYSAPLLPAWPYFLLAALTAVFFWSILTPFADSRYWLWEDFIYQNYPYRVFAATSLLNGDFPFWNPYVFSGQPFFADVLTAVLYPFNLVQTLFATPDGLNPYVVEFMGLLHYLLAGIFMYRLLRLHELELDAALLGAVSFAFSGFLITHVIHFNFINVFVWLPLILEMLERALTTGRLRFVIFSGLAFALSTMGGYPQYSLHINYTLGLYWLLFEIRSRREHGWSWHDAALRLAQVLGVTAIGVGLNAINYLPALELAKYTPRSSMSYDMSVQFSLRPPLLFKLIAPEFFGVHVPIKNRYWGDTYGGFWETCLFVGVLPLIMALWVVLATRWNRQVFFASVLAALAIWLGLGNYGLLYKVFFYCVPGFDRFRIPGRFSALASFALALLAAHGWSSYRRGAGGGSGQKPRFGPMPVVFGLLGLVAVVLLLLKLGLLDGLMHAFLREDPEVKLRARKALFSSLAWISGAGLLIGLTGKLKGRAAAAAGFAAVAFVFCELYFFGAPFAKSPKSVEKIYAVTSVVRGLLKEGQKELFRVNARSLEYPDVMQMQRNQGSIDRVYLIEGYNPLSIERRLGDILSQRMFDLLNVKYKITVDLDKQEMWFVLNPTYLPRAFMMYRWRIIEDDKRIIRTLNSAELFNHLQEVILEEDPGIDMPDIAAHIESNVEITKYGQNEILISVDTSQPGILVMGEWVYPAWKAWVDGKPAKVLRADSALRALALGKGRHQVRYAYSSDTFRTGLLISSLVLLAVLAVSLAAVRLRWW